MSVTRKDYVTSNFQIYDLLRFYKGLKLPKYQRDFSWEKEDIEEVLADIEALFKDKDSTLFLGQFVFANSKKGELPNLNREEADVGEKSEIIDGQQRLTTLTLIYHVILSKICNDLHPNRETARYYNLDSLETEIPNDRTEIGRLKTKILIGIKGGIYQSMLLQDQWKDQGDPKLHKLVKFKNEKHTAFWKIIFSNGHNHETNLSTYMDSDKELWTAGDENLAEAYALIFNHFNIMDEVDFIKNWIPVMFGIGEGENRVHASVMHTSNPQAGIEVFVGINALGKQLNTADLIKAAIYSVAQKRNSSGDNRTAVYMKRWENLEDLVSKKLFGSSNTNPFIEYLSYWITADTSTETVKAKLYDSFKRSNHIDQRENIDVLFNRLEAEAEIYFILRQKKRKSSIQVFTNEMIPNDSLRKALNHVIERLSLLLGPRGVQHLPILLYCFNQLRDNSQSRTIKFTKENNIKYLIKITEHVLLIMLRFKCAGVEAKTLRPKLFGILRKIHGIENASANAKILYETIVEESSDKVQASALTENDCKYLGIGEVISQNEDDNSQKEYLLPITRDNEIEDYLSDEYLTKTRKGTVLAKDIFFELEYRLQTEEDDRYAMMDPDTPHDHTTRAKFQGDHIFPEKSEKYWKPLYSNNAYNALLTLKFSLGNFMLLWGMDNAAAQNKPLADKAKSFFYTRKKTQEYLMKKLIDKNLIKEDVSTIEVIDIDKLNKFWTKKEIEDLLEHYIKNILDKFRYI
ncbi:DUF262 domain-containing protein [Gammaproteobacteria bacterium]|nr:DUF262 domain-containing protein [Gammaproteobacteria bacterium]